MLNSTHTLVGLALARAGVDRWAPYAAWTAVLAANLPDIDIVSQLAGTATYIAYHRGITHTLIGVPVLAVLLALVMHRITGAFKGHFLAALLAGTTHPLLDFANTYGVRPFLPFDDRWFYGDTLFIIDPYVDLTLVVTLVCAAKMPHRRQIVIALGFAVMFIYIGARVELRNMSLRHVDAFAANVPGYRYSAVSPAMLTPFEWTALIDAHDAVRAVPVDAFQGIQDEGIVVEKTHDTVIAGAARSAYAAQVFDGFARFPAVQVHATEQGYSVVFIDVRYLRGDRGFGAQVDLNESLEVIGQSIGFNQAVWSPEVR